MVLNIKCDNLFKNNKHSFLLATCTISKHFLSHLLKYANSYIYLCVIFGSKSMLLCWDRLQLWPNNLYDNSITYLCEFIHLCLVFFFFSISCFPCICVLLVNSVSDFKSFTDLQEIGSRMRENNSMCQEHPFFVLALYRLLYLPWHSIFIAIGQFQV